MKRKPWLIYGLVTTVFNGVWGAFAGIPTEHGFPETLVYVVWALTMIPTALYAMHRVRWEVQIDRQSIFLGLIIGLTGAGGQMLLFHAVHNGPPYLIFPIIALSPVITIALSMLIMRERVGATGALGITLALVALPMFDYVPSSEPAAYGTAWFFYAVIILAAWGVQAYFIKFANRTMTAENIFLYMTLSSFLLIPLALSMTDLSRPINFGVRGATLAAATQILNSIAALTLVYAFRYGKAIIVAPLTNAGAPLITAIISLTALGVMPAPLKLTGIVLAFISAALLAFEPDVKSSGE